MMTTGQRIKLFRKNTGFTQTELAERIGVSGQTLSKWECDGGMPDISQIVPLAKVLGVTTDSILGMGGSEENDIAEVRQMADDMWKEGWDNQTVGKRGCDKIKKEYLALRELVRKYPLNYGIALNCAWRGAAYLQFAVRDKYFELTDGEVQSLFTELERILTSVVNYDRDISRQIGAHRCLCEIYSLTGDYDKADSEADLLPEDEKLKAQHRIAILKKDYDARISAARQMFVSGVYEILWKVCLVGSAYSVVGAPMRENAISVWEFMVTLCDAFSDAGDAITVSEFRRDAITVLAKEYLRSGDTEKVIDYAEMLTAADEAEYALYKKLADGGLELEKTREKLLGSKNHELTGTDLAKIKDGYLWDLVACYDECGDKTGNPVVTSPRFKALVKRLEEM